MTFWKWSRTASSNATADSTCPFPEGMNPGALNDGTRGMMAAAAKYRDDTSGNIVTTGTSTAYAVSSYQGFDTLAHLDGQQIAFTPHTGNGATVTLSVDGLTAKPLRSSPETELPAAVLIAGNPYVATYYSSAGEFILRGFYSMPEAIPIGVGMPSFFDTLPNSNFAFPFGQAFSRTTYATLFARFGTRYGSGDGSTTFNGPDIRGRGIFALDNMGGVAAGRITTAGSGVDGTTIGASGGEQTTTLARSDLPNTSVAVTITDPGHGHIYTRTNLSSTDDGGPSQASASSQTNTSTNAAVTGISAAFNLNGNVTQTNVNKLPPAFVCPVIMRII